MSVRTIPSMLQASTMLSYLCFIGEPPRRGVMETGEPRHGVAEHHT
jgi:hypothetical protein